MSYSIFYDYLGKPLAVNRRDSGASLKFNPSNKTFDESNYLTIELRQWEVTNGALDLSDRAPDPSPDPASGDPEYIDFKYTQRITGLVPAINSNTNKWQVGAGSGILVDNRTTPLAPKAQIIKNSTTQVYDRPVLLDGTTITAVYAYYYWTGTAIAVGYQTTAPISDDLVDKLFICAIISTNSAIISDLRPLSLGDEPEAKALLDNGAVNLDNITVAPVPGTMHLSFPGGRFKFAGRNAYNDPKLPHTLNYNAIAQISYSLFDPNSNFIATETNINFNRYWNGSAVTPLADPNHCSVQFLYLFPSGTFAVVLGINEYTSLDLAVEHWTSYETARLPSKFKNATYFIGAIAGSGTASNIANTLEVAFAHVN